MGAQVDLRLMRTTASYNLFPDMPSERAMARARWLAREGRVLDAEAAYRQVLAEHSDMKAGWAEYFELLRGQRRSTDALHVAQAAQARFPDSGFPLALVGAALIELGHFREALATLEQAVERDPDLGLVWHELGYAAYRLGDKNRALLALDRAFALEPHTETLKLRGRILREAGRFAAAEVAFEGAAQAAEHPEQRDEAEREIIATRRYAFYAPRRPDDLSPAERWFADTGTVVLSPAPGPVPPSDEVLIKAFLELADDRGWRFERLVAVGPRLPCWDALSEQLDLPLSDPSPFATADPPPPVSLVVSARPLPGDAAWIAATRQVTQHNRGLVFVLEHPADVSAAGGVAVDVIGVLLEGDQRRARMPDVAHAMSEAQHPSARCAGRHLD
jgi:Flp pilus assembly protein TadD